MTLLNVAQRGKALLYCIMYFTLMCLVLGPAVQEYMDANGWTYCDDIRNNIKKIKKKIAKKLKTGKKKNRRNGVPSTGGATTITISSPLPSLAKALLGCNSICHRDLEKIHFEKKGYLQSWILLCKEMGNCTAAKVLQRFIRFRGASPIKADCLLKGNTETNRALIRCTELFALLVGVVTPAINRFMRHKKLAQNSDPYALLEDMLKKVTLQPTWINGKDLTITVESSFKGRNSVCHLKLGEIASEHKAFILSWAELCKAMGQALASKVLKKSVPVNARLLKKLNRTKK